MKNLNRGYKAGPRDATSFSINVGFSVAHLGSTERTESAADLIATTPVDWPASASEETREARG